MDYAILFFTTGAVSIGFCIQNILDRKWAIGIADFVAALIFVAVSHSLGGVASYGVVPQEAEDYTKRLDSGTTYEIVQSTFDQGDTVLLVRKIGSDKSGLRAIRVNGLGPSFTYFALVDGKPVAVAAPTVPIDKN